MVMKMHVLHTAKDFEHYTNNQKNVDGLKLILNKTKKAFPNANITLKNELILEPKNNLYFILTGVQNELEFKCKLIAWMSRPISKGLNEYWSLKMLNSFNEVLGTNFTKSDMRKLYTNFGEDTNRTLSMQFVESGFDLSLLK